MLSEANMLLRGCQLRNTDWVLGLVIACGTETKINFSGKAGIEEQKRGKLMQQVNDDIVGVVLWLLFVCLFGGASRNGG